MNNKDLVLFKKRLMADKNSIELKLSVNNYEVDHRGDEIDAANALADMALNIRLSERDLLLVKKINVALSKIDNGTYGECECCGGDIEARRLEVRPTATLCIKCKEEEERREKTFKT